MTLAERLRRVADGRWLDRHVDRVTASLVLAWGLIETSATHHRHGPLALNLVAVAALSALVLVRRRAPLAFAAASFAVALASTIWLTNVERENWTIYVLFIPAYTVAAYEDLPRALGGLALAVAVPAILDTSRPHFFVNVVFTSTMATTSWSTGRAIRHRRRLAEELEQKAGQIAAEREDRARLAVADERSRIARELHAVVANSVSAMVVQAEVAQRQLEEEHPDADATLAAIESTGREALSEMRRILGVLRHSGEDATLAPQPGVGQIHALAEKARARGVGVRLRVDGEPGPLPVAVDLALYRILEEAVESARTGAAAGVDVALRFAEREVELEIVSDGPGLESWPTVGMRERVALCEGGLEVEPAPAGGQRLHAELPRAFDEVFA